MQENIDYSSPNDGLGDKLRNAFIKVQNNFTELYSGKVDKITGKGLSENDFTDAYQTKVEGIESGAQVNVNSDFGENDPDAPGYILNKPPALYSAFGYFHVADLATQTTPLTFVASTPLQLTNDGGGAFTNYTQAPYGVSDIWNTSTNQFDFTKLSVGDAVLVRTDLLISTTSINQNLRLYIKFGVGTASEYDLLIDSWNEKSVVAFEEFIKDVSFSIDNEDWRDAPAKIYILSDDDGEVKVNGFYIPIIRKSVNVIDLTGGNFLSNDETTYTVATLPLTGTEVALLNDGVNWVKITWNNLISSLSSVFQVIEKLVTNPTVTGTYNIDWDNDVWDLILTGNTVLTQSNLPASGKTKTITLNVSGNFTLTYPAGWTSKITGAYSGTATLNTITIQYYGAGKYKVIIVQPT